MAKWGNADFSELKALQEKLQELERIDLDKFCEECSKEMAARLLSFVIPATPLGKYPNETGKKGGTLRRGWTAKSHEDADSPRQAKPKSMRKTCLFQKAVEPIPLRL